MVAATAHGAVQGGGKRALGKRHVVGVVGIDAGMQALALDVVDHKAQVVDHLARLMRVDIGDRGHGASQIRDGMTGLGAVVERVAVHVIEDVEIIDHPGTLALDVLSETMCLGHAEHIARTALDRIGKQQIKRHR